MSSVESWEPLPKRQKRFSKDREIDTGKSNKRCTSSTRPAPIQSVAESIEANIQARSAMIRADTSLASKDGCAGQFFECMFLKVDNIS